MGRKGKVFIKGKARTGSKEMTDSEVLSVVTFSAAQV